ncbi:molybdopterin-guanine dinucleotide biosynthesis protein MobA [compost metagenome]
MAQRLPDGELLVVAVDMPALQPTVLRALQTNRDRACSVFAGHRLPMRLRLDAASRRCLRNVWHAPAEGRSLQALQHALGAHAMAVPEGAQQLFANCNTVEQWQQLQRQCIATPRRTLPTATSG